MSTKGQHHPFRFLAIAFLILLCSPVALFLGLVLAPAVLLFTPLFMMWGLERTVVPNPDLLRPGHAH